MSTLHQFDRSMSQTEKMQVIEDFLKTCKIRTVEVSNQEGSWTVHLEMDNLLDYSYLENLAIVLQGCSEALNEVNIIPYYNLANIDFQTIKDKELNLIRENLCWLFPEIKIWLMNATLDLRDMVFYIRLPSSMGVTILSRSNYERLIHGCMKDNFCLDLDVKVVVKEKDEPENDNLLEQYVKKVQNNVNKKISASTSNKVDKRDNKEKNIVKSNVIFGKPLKNSMETTIKQLGNEDQPKVAISGEIFSVETIRLKSGKIMVSFNISDQTDSITVKVFERGETQINFPLKDGMAVRVVGDVQFDKYSGEQIVIAKYIEKSSKDIRMDLAKKKRIELHLHTKYSSMDGLVDVEACIERAAMWGHKAIAITDHGVIQGFPSAFAAGKKHGIKIIYGLEGYLVKSEDLKNMPRYHVIILAQNQQGLENLYRLVSLSHLEYFYRRPLIPQNILEKYREGLILGTACESGELIQAYLSGAKPEELIDIVSFYDFLELQPRANNRFLIENKTVKSEDDFIDMYKTILQLGKDLNKPVVAAGDVHFLDSHDEIFRRILMVGQGYKDDDQAPLYFKTTEEMLDEFAYLGEEDAQAVVVDNTYIISDMIEELSPVPKGFFPPKIAGSEKEIEDMTWKNAKYIYGDPVPEIVAQRINRELNSIISNGYSVLYLISHKLVKKSNEDGFLVGSRGSVGSSLVATLTGITEVNPLAPHYICDTCKYNEFITDGSVGSGADLPDKSCPKCNDMLRTDGHQIPFEVFMGFEGDKVPDIDLNFSGEYQLNAHKYTEELFGSDKVFRAGTIATVAEKTAFGFVKKFIEEGNIRCRTAEMDRLIKNCTGVKRTTGQHPGGLMIVPQDKEIYAFTPIQRPADDAKTNTVTTHFDYQSIQDCLVKLDILGHDDPTMIKLLEDFTGIDAKTISLNDKETMGIFSGLEPLNLMDKKVLNTSIGTIGIPEFGTKFVRGMLEETKPGTFAELVRISGLSHGTDVWLNNAQDLIKNKTANLSETIACRDDIMVYLIEKGLPALDAFKIMEDVRKGKGVKQEYKEIMNTHEVPDWYINSCERIKYMFPKAHAVAYVTMAFRIAYFKVKYPEAFYAAIFSVRGGDFDAELICQGEEKIIAKMQEIEAVGNQATAKEKGLYNILEMALEMYLRGIKPKMVDLWESDSFNFKIINGQLLCPFISLQGLGETAAKNIIEARKSEITSIEDLQNKAKLTKPVIQVLKDNGVLEGLPEQNQLTLF